MELLPGVFTSCLLAWVLIRLVDKQNDERQAHRTEVAHAARALLEQVQMHRVEVDALTTAHAEQVARLLSAHSEQVARLLTAHRQEVANLCQRIQAPEIAVAEHVGQNITHDPPQVDLENDEILAQIAQREMDLRMMEQSLTERAEDLAVER